MDLFYRKNASNQTYLTELAFLQSFCFRVTIVRSIDTITVW